IGTRHSIACVVHQRINGEATCFEFRAKPLGRAALREIALDHLDANAVLLLKPSLHAAEPGFSPRGDHEIESSISEDLRKCFDDARWRAGDERDAPHAALAAAACCALKIVAASTAPMPGPTM